MRTTLTLIVICAATAAARADQPAAQLVDPTGSSGTSAGAPADLWSTLLLEASTESKKAKARVGWSSSDWLGEASVTTPIDEGDEEAELANLDGLAGGSTLELGVGYVLWNPHADAIAQTKACAGYAVATYECDPKKLPKEIAERITKAQAEVCKQHGVATCTRDGLPNDAAKLAFDEATAAVCRSDRADLEVNPKQALTRMKCTSVELADKEHPEFRRQFDAATNYGSATLFGARAKIGRQSFKFADPMTYAKQTADETTFALSASLGRIVEDVVYVALSYEFQSTLKEGTSAERCRPLDMSGNLECLTLALGAPTRSRSHLVRGELRRFISDKAAVVFRAAYDFSDKVLGFEVPIYFLQRKDEGLAGGVTFGFRNDQDSPSVMLFISETLQFGELP
jgi:hypothetical protein